MMEQGWPISHAHKQTWEQITGFIISHVSIGTSRTSLASGCYEVQRNFYWGSQHTVHAQPSYVMNWSLFTSNVTLVSCIVFS